MLNIFTRRTYSPSKDHALVQWLVDVELVVAFGTAKKAPAAFELKELAISEYFLTPVWLTKAETPMFEISKSFAQ